MLRDANDLLHGTLDVLVLKTLSWGPMHGYGIARWIEDRTRNELAIVDAALRVQSLDVPAAEPEAHVMGAQPGADVERRGEGFAKRGVDALELVTERNNSRVDDEVLDVDAGEDRGNRVVQSLPVTRPARLDDVTDEGDPFSSTLYLQHMKIITSYLKNEAPTTRCFYRARQHTA